jgi:hypothetical protein
VRKEGLTSLHLVRVLDSSAATAAHADEAIVGVGVLQAILGTNTVAHHPVGRGGAAAIPNGTLTVIDTRQVESSEIARNEAANKAHSHILETAEKRNLQVGHDE